MLIEDKFGNFINLKEQKKIIDDGLRNWRKVTMKELNKRLRELKSFEKIEIWFWFVENMNSRNEVNTTQKEVGEETNKSKKTIDDFFRICREQNLILKNKGLYVVNPFLIGVYGGGLKSLESLELWENLTYNEEIKTLERNRNRDIKEFENNEETLKEIENNYKIKLSSINYKWEKRFKKLREEYKHQELNKPIENNYNENSDDLPF